MISRDKASTRMIAVGCEWALTLPPLQHWIWMPTLYTIYHHLRRCIFIHCFYLWHHSFVNTHISQSSLNYLPSHTVNYFFQINKSQPWVILLPIYSNCRIVHNNKLGQTLNHSHLVNHDYVKSFWFRPWYGTLNCLIISSSSSIILHQVYLILLMNMKMAFVVFLPAINWNYMLSIFTIFLTLCTLSHSFQILRSNASTPFSPCMRHMS